MSELAVKIEGLKKQYRLGAIGGGTLTADLQSWWAKKRGLEDPNTKIGTDQSKAGSFFYALNGIDLEVKKGEALGIIGTNGAGKSTLLKLLSRVTSPTEGTISINGRIASMLEVGTGFHPELTGRENIYMNGAILGMTKEEIDSKIEEIIDFSECRQFIDTPVKRYSSGMYVKLAFAVAAHLDAEIMIMDEVLAVGDVKFQKKCLGKMGEEAHGGKTVLYVSHNMSTIRQLCTRCIVLDHGRIIYDGDVEEAIRVYTEEEKGDLVNHYDLTDAPRPEGTQHGREFKIDSFDFVGRDIPVYYNNEELVWSMDYHVTRDYDDLGIYYTVCHEDSTIVGTAQCCNLGSLKAGDRKKCQVRMDISNLVEGTYYFYLDIFYMNEFNTFWSVDHPLTKIYFAVKDDVNRKSILWQRVYYGSVRLNDLEIISNDDI